MKKILLGICSLAFVSCLSAGIALNNSVEVANAETTSVFTETKCQVSNAGDKMLIVTGIKKEYLSLVYKVGYEVNGQEYVAGEGETAETTKYYESLTLSGGTKDAATFYDNNEEVEGLLIWEINYDNTQAYSVQPYAYVGDELDSGVLVAPEDEEEAIARGTKKENFNVLTVTFVDEEGNKLGEKKVNYGATVSENEITAPEAKDWYEFDGWYLGEEKYDFEQPIEKNIELTATYVKSKTMVYSAEKGNIKDIATPLNGVELTTEDHAFVNNSIPLNTTVKALTYKYSGEAVTAAHTLGLTFNFGTIKLSDYDTIKITFHKKVTGTKADGTALSNTTFTVFSGGKALESWWSDNAAYIVDVKAKAEEQKLTEIDSLEISVGSVGNVTGCEIYVASIEFVLADKVEEPEPNPEVPAGPQSVTYSVENGNIIDVAKVLGNNGTLSTENHAFTNLSANVLVYNYTGAGTSAAGDHTIGLTLDFGSTINLSDYESINITFGKTVTATNGTSAVAEPTLLVYGDGTQISSYYNQKVATTLDVKTTAQTKGLTTLNSIELSVINWAYVTECNIYVVSIEFVAK